MHFITELFSIELPNEITSVVTAGKFIVATSSDGCAHFIRGKEEVYEVCGKSTMSKATYSYDKVVLSNYDGNVYIHDIETNQTDTVEVGSDYNEVATLCSDMSVLACGWRCGSFVAGIKLFDFDVGWVINPPAEYKRYWFVADVEWFKVLIVEDDVIVKEIPYGEKVYDVKVCGDKLIVATESKIILNKIDRPSSYAEIWRAEGFGELKQIAVSEDCKRVLAVDAKNKKLVSIDLEEKSISAEVELDEKPTSVAWYDKMTSVVGMKNGMVKFFRIMKGFGAFF